MHVSVGGRTDAGVHADGQTVSFGTDCTIAPDGLRRALAQWLPDDIWIVDADDAPADFDARHSASRRWYHYAIWRGDSVPTRWHGRALAVHDPLDLDAMRAAAGTLVGTRDMRALAARPLRTAATVRTIFAADLLEVDPNVVLFEICADAFLTHMVRAIVGGLLWVGTGRWTADQFTASLASGDRQQAGPNAPAHGLTLSRIDY